MTIDDRITLGRKAFKALSSDSRVSILKSLGRRRKMLAELSNELGMSPSTMKEHMDSLVGAGLVAKIDDGHKWKSYELTRAGRTVVSPGETRIWVIISISAFALLLTGYGFMGGFDGRTMLASSGSLNDLTKAAPAAAAETAPVAANTGIYAAGFIIFALILGISTGYLWCRRRMSACSD